MILSSVNPVKSLRHGNCQHYTWDTLYVRPVAGLGPSPFARAIEQRSLQSGFSCHRPVSFFGARHLSATINVVRQAMGWSIMPLKMWVHKMSSVSVLFFLYFDSGFLPVPPSHAILAHNPPSLRALFGIGDNSREPDKFLSFPEQPLDSRHRPNLVKILHFWHIIQTAFNESWWLFKDTVGNLSHNSRRLSDAVR